MRLPTRYGFALTPPGLACCCFLFVCSCHMCCDTSPALLLSCRFFLAGHCLLRPTSCARIGARALAAHRQVAAMAHATIAADFDEPLNVHIHFAAQVTLDLILAVDHLTQAVDLFFSQ